MDIRVLPASRGLAWFRLAIDLGARNPRAVFGAAFLLIATLYTAVLAMALILSLLLGGQQPQGQTPELRLVMLAAGALTLLVMFLVPILLGGLMHVVRETESGRPARARDLFAPLSSDRGRALAWLGLVQVLLTLAGALLALALAGTDYWRDYLHAMEAVLQGAAQAPPEPRHPLLLFVLQSAFNYFSYTLLLLSIPLMLFSGCGLGEALRAAFKAAVRNAGANLLAAFLCIGALIVGALVASLLAALASAVGGVLHAAVGGVLAALVMLCFAAIALVLVTGGAYVAWRETFGDAAASPPAGAAHQIEV